MTFVWFLLLLFPIGVGFGWVVGNLQGKASLSFGIAEITIALDRLKKELDEAYIEIARQRLPSIGHASSVSVLHDLDDAS